jgi:hypothetical protein
LCSRGIEIKAHTPGADLKLARQGRHHRIMVQLAMIGGALAAECNPNHALTDNCGDLMLDRKRSLERVYGFSSSRPRILHNTRPYPVLGNLA